nr:hypothetical protein [Myceligenerans indicum]
MEQFERRALTGAQPLRPHRYRLHVRNPQFSEAQQRLHIHEDTAHVVMDLTQPRQELEAVTVMKINDVR